VRADAAHALHVLEPGERAAARALGHDGPRPHGADAW
jgi:hypothetical protein